MAITTRAHHFGNSGVTAAEFREVTEHVFGRRKGGVLRTGSTPDNSLLVDEASTPNMSVDVADGAAVVQGTEATAQGVYLIENGASANIAISAADPTNARKDLIVARIKDQDYASGSPSTNTATLEAITGTPAASPADPTVPANCVVLARVDVPANDTAITNSQITDLRWNGASVNANQDNGSAVLHGGTSVGLSTARPLNPYDGMEFYETDTDRRVRWSGSAWVGDGIFVPWTTSHTNITFSSEEARYSRIGDTIIAKFRGVVSAVSGSVFLSLPVAPSGDWIGSTDVGRGSVYAVDSVAGTRHVGAAKLEPTQLTVYPADHGGTATGNFWNNTRPHTWAAGDTIVFTIIYEA